MENLLKDVRYGIRVLLKSPGFTAVALLALTLGIGANTAIFSVVNTVLLRPLAYKDADRLMTVWETQQSVDKESASIPNFNDWRAQNQSFDDMAAAWRNNLNITGSGEPERLLGRMVTSNFLSVLGVQPQLGRDFSSEDERAGSAPTVIISNGLWQRRFGSNPDIIDSQITLNDTSFTVIGVLSPAFHFYTPADVFAPISFMPERLRQAREEHGGVITVARLKSNVTPEQALADLNNIAASLEIQYPKTNSTNRVLITPIYEDMVGDIKPSLFILLGAVAFVLLIACANVANLLLARAAARQKEIAIRTALGATRARVVRQLLTESIVLSLLGGALGLLVALWGADLLYSAMPNNVPWIKDIGLDKTVLVFTLTVSMFTGIIFGLVPALGASNPDLNETLKEGGRGSTAARSRARSALVVAEVALALILLIGAGLMLRSFARVNKLDPGFDAQNLLTMQVLLSPTRYSEDSKARAYYDQIIERVGSLPGVESAALSTSVPLNGATVTGFSIEGPAQGSISDLPLTVQSATSAKYLATMGIPLLKGRYFDEQDTVKTPLVAIIDESFARDFFPDSDPLGRLIFLDQTIKLRIVGVVGHVRHLGFETDEQSKIRYQMYTAFAQIPEPWYARVGQNMQLAVRTRTDAKSLIAAVRGQVLEVDHDQPVYNIKTMQQLIADTISEKRFAMLMLGIFATVAVILAAVGIYGVMSYAVTQRRREIGIRMALGAQSSDVLRLVVSHGFKLALTGVGLGLTGAFLLTRLMSSLLYGVSATDPATFAVTSVILTGVALGACFIPARRATKVDPMVALRYE
ncbi:MAG: ABC transporter permease [Blastocatellia bacterium]